MEGEHESKEIQGEDFKREAKARLRQVDRAHGRLAKDLELTEPGDKYALARKIADARGQPAAEDGDVPATSVTPQGKADEQA